MIMTESYFNFPQIESNSINLHVPDKIESKSNHSEDTLVECILSDYKWKFEFSKNVKAQLVFSEPSHPIVEESNWATLTRVILFSFHENILMSSEFFSVKPQFYIKEW